MKWGVAENVENGNEPYIAAPTLLNNFEIVVTSLIALFIFKETIGKRMWLAILFITASSMILSVSDFGKLSFSAGSLFVLAACFCWGFENNCTRMISIKDPVLPHHLLAS